MHLKDAIQIAEAAVGFAKQITAMPLSITILDTSGNTKYLLNQDGTGIIRNEISFGKAWTCLAMGFSSRDLSRNLKNRPSFLNSLSTASAGKMIFAPGGILLLDKDSKSVVGAMGVSGDTSHRDEYVAIAAAQKCGFLTSPAQPNPNYMKSHL